LGRDVGGLSSLTADEQVGEALPEQTALVKQWEGFLIDRTGAKVLAEFIERGTEASGTGERAEAAHRVVALFDRAVVLLEPIIEILTGAMHGLAAHDTADGAWISIVPIGRHPLRLVPNRLDRLVENIPCRCGILPGEKLNEARCACSGSCSTILTCIPEK
jgi:hypothetical protein